MQILFLSNLFFYFGKIFSIYRIVDLFGKNFTEYKNYCLMEFCTYVVFREFEGKLYEKNIEILNDENIELNYFLKFKFALFDSVFKSGGFKTFPDFIDKFIDFNRKTIKIFYKKTIDKIEDNKSSKFNEYSYEDYTTHKSNLEYIRKKFFFEHISVENVKKLFYFSSYLKNLDEAEINYYYETNKTYFLQDFIDLLNLEDKNIIRELKTEKSKFNIKTFIAEDEIADKIYTRLEKNIQFYEEKFIEKFNEKHKIKSDKKL